MNRNIKFKVFDILNNKLTSTNIAIDFNNKMCHLLDEECGGNPSFITDFTPLQFTGIMNKKRVERYMRVIY